MPAEIGIVGNEAPISFKSKLHEEVKRQNRENKESKIRAFSEKQLKAER